MLTLYFGQKACFSVMNGRIDGFLQKMCEKRALIWECVSVK